MSQDPMTLLCVEPYFPGRLGAIADWLVRRRGYRVHFYCHQVDAEHLWPESVGRGLELVHFNVGGVAKSTSVHWSRNLERGLCYAYGAWEVYDALRPRPISAILGRSSGLGSTLFASHAYPGIPRINFFDYYYHAHQHDVVGESGTQFPPDYYMWRRAANTMDLLDLENDSTAVIPTNWQRELYPREYQNDFSVIFDGVDSRKFVRAENPADQFLGQILKHGTKVVTYIAGAPDYVRGFERFVSLANRVMKARPDVIFVVAGGGTVSRMLDVRFHAQDYVQYCLANEPLVDPSRFWNLGVCAPHVIAEILGRSDLHVYPSRPFPVAKSAVEAMSAGAVVLAWDSEAIREFIQHESTGLIVAPDDLENAESLALRVLENPGSARHLGDSAAIYVRSHHSQDVCLPKLAQLLDRLVGEQ